MANPPKLQVEPSSLGNFRGPLNIVSIEGNYLEVDFSRLGRILFAFEQTNLAAGSQIVEFDRRKTACLRSIQPCGVERISSAAAGIGLSCATPKTQETKASSDRWHDPSGAGLETRISIGAPQLRRPGLRSSSPHALQVLCRVELSAEERKCGSRPVSSTRRTSA
jgi:hypothetical protein